MRGAGIAALVLGSAIALPASEQVAEQIKAEKNLERRASRAMDHAAKIMNSLREVYRGGDWKQVEANLAEIAEMAELARDSLAGTGRDARRHPRHFKRAEQSSRELMRRLESFGQEVNFEERESVDKARRRVEVVHDELLRAIFGGKD